MSERRPISDLSLTFCFKREIIRIIMLKTTLKYLLCIIFWCYLTYAQALTLSDIETKSFLNQMLNARVNITNASAAELENLEIGFVESTTQTVSGAVHLNAELVDDSTGSYIQITSKEIIREPVVTFTLELVWPAGRLQREYSLLMDPKN
jgi:pilus assembly protein FimV